MLVNSQSPKSNSNRSLLRSELRCWITATRTMAPMLDGARFLSADQFLLTTLIVKLAVMAVLATMLARYRRFRHILIFERRVWLDRLVFTLALGIPLMAGVAARLLLNYKAADLTLEGAFLAGLIAGPYAGALVGVLVGMPALIAGEVHRAPVRGRLRLRGRRPSRSVPEGNDLAVHAVRLHRPAQARVADGAEARRQLAAVAAARARSRSSCCARRSARASASNGCSIPARISARRRR